MNHSHDTNYGLPMVLAAVFLLAGAAVFAITRRAVVAGAADLDRFDPGRGLRPCCCRWTAAAATPPAPAVTPGPSARASG